MIDSPLHILHQIDTQHTNAVEGEVPGSDDVGLAAVDQAKKQKVMLWLLVQSRRNRRLYGAEQDLVSVETHGPASPRIRQGARALTSSR